MGQTHELMNWARSIVGGRRDAMRPFAEPRDNARDNTRSGIRITAAVIALIATVTLAVPA
jgi:hypothetical protein